MAKAKKVEMSKDVRFRCLKCGTEEDIPRDVVQMMDLEDGGDVSVPPRFSCEECGHPYMEPIYYESAHGIIYKIEE